MKKSTQYFVVVLLLILSTTGGYSQVIPFDSDRWEIRAGESKLVDYLGRSSLFMKGGLATIKDSDFKNGTVEFDIAFSGERGFMGAGWRIIDPDNYEQFYVRPHQSGKPDANQYTPIFNGLAGWQLYHGDGYGAQVEYLFDEWMHVKIVVSGSRGEVYIMDMEKPALIIHEMKREIKSGKVGLMCSNFAPAYFSNFQFTSMNNPALKGQAKQLESAPEGTITGWLVSNPFHEKILIENFRLMKADKIALTWTRLSSEQSGITNLAKVHKIEQGKNTVFAKVIIISDREQFKKLKFGYSDRIKAYFNDRLIYGGSNLYRSRDFRYLGTIGYFDELYLPLKKGENELWLAVSEAFGGWGVQAMFEDVSGIRIKE